MASDGKNTPCVHYLQYEDLRNTEEGYPDGIGSLCHHLNALYYDHHGRQEINYLPAVQAPRDEDCPDFEEVHVADKLFMKIKKATEVVKPGDVVFIVLSGHGDERGICIGHPNPKILQEEHVKEAFFAAQHRRSEDNGVQPAPVTVVLIMNCCSSITPQKTWTGDSRRKREVEKLKKDNRAEYRKCTEQGGGQDYVRWAVLRPERGYLAPGPKLLVPCFFEALANERSLLKALCLDSLRERMEKRAADKRIEHCPKLRVSGPESWDVDVVSEDGKCCLIKVKRAFIAEESQVGMMSRIAALEQQLERERMDAQHRIAALEQQVACAQQHVEQRADRLAALEQQAARLQHAKQRAADRVTSLEQQGSTQSRLPEQPGKQAAHLAGQLQQERKEMNLQREMDLTGHTVVQAAPDQGENCSMADVWGRLHTVCQNEGCEQLSGSGRGGERRKRRKTVPTLFQIWTLGPPLR